MKIFLAKLLLFLALFVAADMVLGMLVGHFHLKTKNTVLTNANYGFVGYKNDDILLFGASEVSHTFISDMITEETGLSTYNLASDGCGIFYQYALLETILEKHTPKVVLLSTSQLIMKELDYVSRMYPYYKNNKYVKSVVDKLNRYERFKLFFQGYVYNSQIIRIFDAKDDNSSGYIALPAEEQNAKISEIENLPLGLNHDIDPEIKAYYKKFMDLAHSSGVTVYAYFPPQLEIINPEYLDTILTVTKNTEAKVINLSSDWKILGRPELFFDKTHLNHAGAKVTTDRFIKILKEDNIY